MNYFKTLKNDWRSYITFLFGIMLLSFAIIIGLSKITIVKYKGFHILNSDESFTIAVILTSFSILLFLIHLLRIIKIKKILKSGNKLLGQIISLEFNKDRGYIHFKYTYNNTIVKNKLAVYKSKQVKTIQPGDSVSVILLKEKNKLNALIEELYLKK